jgi:broad specificity phosphatase PhoE
MRERLLLVRHTGVTLVEGIAPAEWPASPEGLDAAERLAAAPLFEAVAAIASSPERKALATAEPIAQRLGLEIAVEPDLREVERPSGPIVTSEEVARRVAAYLDDGGFEGWEPPGAARERVTACIERLRAEAGGPLVVVSHGLLLTLFRGDSFALWRKIPLPAVAIADGDEMGSWLSVDDVAGPR